MSNEDMISMKWHRKDWEFLCEALGHAESNIREASQRYAKTPEDTQGYKDLAETAYKLSEGIQYQLGNRSYANQSQSEATESGADNQGE